MPFPIMKDGRILFANGAPAMSEDCCCGNQCQSCGSCSFDDSASIQNYLYIKRSKSGENQVKYEATGDFAYAGNCRFCQEYRVYAWNSSTEEWEFVEINTGGGETLGFRYIGEFGWWDGNGASAGEPYDPPNRVVILIEGGNQSRRGTVFSCGVCCGWVRVTYYYGDGSEADVEFYVNNPNCGTSE